MIRPVKLFLCYFKGCVKQNNGCARRGFSLSTRHLKVRLSYAIFPEGRELDISQKSPIFIAHGMLGNKYEWKPRANDIALATDRTVVTLDARNHGNSERHKLMDYLLMRDDLVGAMDDLRVERPILMGFGMGAKTAMACALSMPVRVDRLIVVDTIPRESPESHLQMRLFAEGMRDATMPPPTDLPPIARRFVGDQLKDLIKDPSDREFLVSSNLRQTPNGEYEWSTALDPIITHFDSLHSFPTFSTPSTVPTILIAGGGSEYVGDDGKEYFRSLFPACTIEVVAGARHWVHNDKPREFVQVVQNFLS